jgi:hypothetical protein
MVLHCAGQRRRKCCSLRGVTTARDGTQAALARGYGWYGGGAGQRAGVNRETAQAGRAEGRVEFGIQLPLETLFPRSPVCFNPRKQSNGCYTSTGM